MKTQEFILKELKSFIDSEIRNCAQQDNFIALINELDDLFKAAVSGDKKAIEHIGNYKFPNSLAKINSVYDQFNKIIDHKATYNSIKEIDELLQFNPKNKLIAYLWIRSKIILINKEESFGCFFSSNAY